MEREGGLKEIPSELWGSLVHLGNFQTEAEEGLIKLLCYTSDRKNMSLVVDVLCENIIRCYMSPTWSQDCIGATLSEPSFLELKIWI